MDVRTGDTRQLYGWVADYLVGDPVMSLDSYRRYRNDTATRGTQWQATLQEDYQNYLASALQRSVQPAMQKSDAVRREQLRLQGRQTNYAPYLSDAKPIDSLLQAAQPYVQGVKSWSGDLNPAPMVLMADAQQLAQQWMQGGSTTAAQPAAQQQQQQQQSQPQSNTQPTAQAQIPPAMQITRTQKTVPGQWTTPDQTQEQSFQAQAPKKRAAKPIDMPDYLGTPDALLQTYQQNAMQGRGAGGWA